MSRKRREPYTFLTFTAGFPACAVEVMPENLHLWKTLCGQEHNRTTGSAVKNARRCRDCRMEVQRRTRFSLKRP